MSETTTLPGRAATGRRPATSATRPGREARTARLALAGCGVVGGALVRLIAERAPWLGIESVLVRTPTRHRRAPVDPDTLTGSLAAFLRSDADVVVEAIGGIEPALEIALATLRRGAHFVTANKALVARHGPELQALADTTGATFRFEGSVGGGVPILRTIRDALRPVGIRSIRGVLNGTCNYVLGRLEDGLSFETAVAEAQTAGYAEADPTRDLDGTDAEDKVRILAWLAWGVDPARVNVERSGLLPDPARVIAAATGEGRVARMIGECRRTETGAVARVGVEVLEPADELARAPGPENRIVVETADGHLYGLTGPGAGGAATAAAVLGDVLEVVGRPSQWGAGSVPAVARQDRRRDDD